MMQEISDMLKMPGPISQNGNFYSNDASLPKISWFQISFKSVKVLFPDFVWRVCRKF